MAAWLRRAFSKHGVVVAIALGLALRLTLLIALPQAPFSDGAWYVDRAREIAAGQGYGELGIPTAFWPAGYPVLLGATMWLVGPSLFGAMLLNLIAAAVTIWLIDWFGRQVVDSPAAGRIAAFAYACYPAHIGYAGAPMAEVVSTALLAGAVAAMLAARGRPVWLLLAGLLFGAATLMRAQFLYVPAGISIAMMVLRPQAGWLRAVVAVAIVYVGVFAAVLPLTVRNHAVLGSWVLVSTNGGVALRTGANDEATGDHLDWDAARWNREGVPFEQRTARQVEADALFRRSATDWIAANPARWLALMPVKAATLWAKDTDGFWGLQLTYPRLITPLKVVAALNQLGYLAVLLLSSPAVWAGLRGLFNGDRQRRQLLFLFLIPAFVTLVAMVFTGQIRYHFPAMPFLFVAAGWTIATYCRRVLDRVTGARRAAT